MTRSVVSAFHPKLPLRRLVVRVGEFQKNQKGRQREASESENECGVVEEKNDNCFDPQQAVQKQQEPVGFLRNEHLLPQ